MTHQKYRERGADMEPSEHRRSRRPRKRLFFKRTLKRVYLDFTGTGVLYTILHLLSISARLSESGTSLYLSGVTIGHFSMFMLAISFVAYCINYRILVREGRIRPKFKTFLWGFLINVAFFVGNVLLLVLFKPLM